MSQALWSSSSRQEVAIIDNIHLMGILHAITRTVRFEGKNEGIRKPNNSGPTPGKGSHIITQDPMGVNHSIPNPPVQGKVREVVNT